MSAIQSAVTSSLPWMPSDNGLLIANGDPAVFSGGLLLSAGLVYLAKLTARAGLTISNLWWNIEAVGSGTSTGSFTGLYAMAGGNPLTGSSDIASLFNGSNTGGVECALTTPQVLTAGESVWAAIVFNLSVTQPTLFRGAGNVGGAGNVNLTAATARFATAQGSGFTSLPSITPANNVFATSTLWCGGS